MFKVTLGALSHAQDELAAMRRRMDCCIDKMDDVISALRDNGDYEELLPLLRGQRQGIVEEKLSLLSSQKRLGDIQKIYYRGEGRIMAYEEELKRRQEE